MEFDASRNRTLTAEPFAAHSTKAHLSALADTLEKAGMRARIIDRSTGPDVMRCWNPQVMCTSLEVTCQQHPERDELAFFMGGEVLAAADRPEDAAAILTERLQGCGP
ncbi:hypothetical protein [Thermomonospora cellulosilytica]|uniref:Uncharacterized protein n=1 Tax=Thermomonospora cellulosilytica TaxID=1411118 RepID=A0A7W3MWG3_9ACTN|nr:hypothetical protein [Thermomonospora cellulosilytica]MBA9003067.1 hypothetical protein [Thermomonospora cellulosilytica]